MDRPALLLLLIYCGLCLHPSFGVYDLEAAAEASKPNLDLVRRALHHALDLQFDQAIELTDQRDGATSEPSPASQLTRGMIAYFQARWQTLQSPAADDVGHQALTALLEQQPHNLETSLAKPWPQLLLGTAAIFDALLQQSAAPFQSLQRFGQGRAWLQQVFINDETAADAHLGLGLTYFAADTRGLSHPAPVAMERRPGRLTGRAPLAPCGRTGRV
jgi:hypothetical protein